jgi:hypothetical protein
MDGGARGEREGLAGVRTRLVSVVRQLGRSGARPNFPSITFGPVAALSARRTFSASGSPPGLAVEWNRDSLLFTLAERSQKEPSDPREFEAELGVHPTTDGPGTRRTETPARERSRVPLDQLLRRETKSGASRSRTWNTQRAEPPERERHPDCGGRPMTDSLSDVALSWRS